MKKVVFKWFIIVYFTCVFSIIFLRFFSPIFDSNSVSIFFAVHPFDICEKFPIFWLNLKRIYVVICVISCFIISNFLCSIFIFLFSNHNFVSNSNDLRIYKNNDDSIYLGKNSDNLPIYVPISGLYQNMLVTGSIGSGKTSSLLYPVTEQLLQMNFSGKYKSAFLILDVKGNYHKFVKMVCMNCFHFSDLIIINLENFITYNPLDKPNLKPHVLANRLKNILLLFSPQQTESYWIDKAEQILTEAIKLCRIYNDGYVTFVELHKLIFSKDYYQEKVEFLKSRFLDKSLSNDDIAALVSCMNFFEDEFFSLDDRTQSILKSEISRITNVFVSDEDAKRTFCPDKENISFPGFDYVLKNHKIVVLDMNVSEYSNLAKIVAAYLKIDFQSEILSQLSKDEPVSPSCFICDEYHEYVTQNDSAFFAQSREAKSINIVATQSYSSLLAAIHNDTVTRTLIQNLVNKFWFRTDDSFTIEEAIKQTGKEEKEVLSKSISENARTTNYNFLFHSLLSKDSNISESFNTSIQKDFIYDSNFFSRELDTFNCLAFISSGSFIYPLEKLHLTPYFLKERA